MSNQAKNWQEGHYTVLVDGKIIAVSKKVKAGKNELGVPIFKTVTTTARCAPGDDFSLSMGVTLAMDRLNKQLESANKEIKVGDRVLITDPAKAYTAYVEWVIKHVQDIAKVAMYRCNALPDCNIIGKVIAVDNNKNKTLVYIEEDWHYGIIRSGCWLMNINGVRKL